MIRDLTINFRKNKISAEEFVSSLKSHFDSREPDVLSFAPESNRFERLRKEAEGLVKKYPDVNHRPPLFGMPVGVKDIFHADGFTTQAGSKLPAEELQGNEAESVTQLKNAGALILGKTVTTEFAYFTPGPTRNPHNPHHTPGGSSSGSAAAVGAGLCLLSLGTQTIGSIIRPAAFCGVVGIKPTYERISRDGVIPLSPTLDHIGYFTPNVSIANQAAPSLYKDWDDSISFDKKPTLGIPEGPYLACASNEALACFNTICDSLADAGYELRRVPVMNDYQEIRARHDVVMSAEAAHGHKTWFEKFPEKYSPKFTELIQRGQKITNDQLQNAHHARDNFRAELRRAMIDNNIALWIAPSAIGPAPKGLDSTGDPVMNLPWTQAGLPAINLPTEKDQDGLPMGLQVVGNWYKDESLLAWAEDLEKVVTKS